MRLVLPDGARLMAGRPEILVDDLAGSGGRHELLWLVNGLRTARPLIEVTSDHAGVLRAEVEVQR